MAHNWASILGQFEKHGEAIIFKGGVVDFDDRPGAEVGNFICDQQFGGGAISADIKFDQFEKPPACEIIIYFNPETKAFVTAGFGQEGLYTIRHFDGKWKLHATAGDRRNLIADKDYKVKITLSGSHVVLNVDGVNVCSTNLPFTLPQSQTGIWCLGETDIHISNFKVERIPPKVFVVMQFTAPYNELYEDVIKKVCNEFDLEANRADETYGPGLIISDISKQIIDSKIIIADITPANPNVYYEVGYAHALNKPTILIAEKPTELPFDVSPFRTLFYENSIGGKKHVEDGLRKHIQAILSEWYGA